MRALLLVAMPLRTLDRNRRSRLNLALEVILKRMAETVEPLSLEAMFRGVPDTKYVSPKKFADEMVEKGLFSREEDGNYMPADREALRSAKAGHNGIALFSNKPRVQIEETPLRKIVRAMLERGWMIIDPLEVYNALLKIGGPPMTETEVVSAIASMDEFDIEPVTKSVDGNDGRTVFKSAKVGLAACLTADYVSGGWELGATPGEDPEAGFRVTSKDDRAISMEDLMVRKAVAVKEAKRAAEELRKEAEGLHAQIAAKIVEDFPDRLEFTTKEVVVEIMGMKPGPDGRYNKMAAAGLKLAGFRREDRTIEGKKTVMFVRRQKEDRGGPEDEVDLDPIPDPLPTLFPARLPDPVPEPDPEPDPAPEPDPWSEMAAAAVAGSKIAAETDKAEEELETVYGRKLPYGWREAATDYVSTIGAGSFVSVEEILLRGLGKMPHDVDFRQKGILSVFFIKLGLEQSKFGDLKVLHAPGLVPSQKEVLERAEALKKEISDALMIKTSNAPDWMGENDVLDLSYLEHAVLLLCDGEWRPRTALFPGHPRVEWQKAVLRSLMEEGVVETEGNGFYQTYRGLVNDMNLLLSGEDTLVSRFWPEEAAADRARRGAWSMDDLELSVRTAHELQNAGIRTVDELVLETKESLRKKGVSSKGVKDIRNELWKLSLKLAAPAELGEEVIDSAEPPDPPAAAETVAESAAAEAPDKDRYEEVEELRELVKEMFAVLGDHAETIKKMKRQIRELQAQFKESSGG